MIGGEKLRQNNIAFSNLRAEMSRYNISILEMAKQLGCNRDTLSRRLANKSMLNLYDAFAIQQEFFPDLPVEYLFAEACTNAAASALASAAQERRG